jgi:hypothetical protein
VTTSTILRPTQAPGKPTPSKSKIDLPDDALDGLYDVPAGPPSPPAPALWTFLCDRMPILRRYRGSNETAPILPVSVERMAEFLAMLCDPDFRELVLTILAPGFRVINQDELRKAGKL